MRLGLIESCCDGAGGRLQDASLLDTPLATACDVPALRTVIVEERCSDGPYGAAGGGPMRVAIAVCRGRVSPLFDEAREILVTDLEGQRAWERRPLGSDRAAGLAENGIDVLICGAVSTALRRRVTAAGIVVRDWVRGEAREVLEAYAGDHLGEARFRLPGIPEATGSAAQV